jgi:hypothetical protein
MSRLELSGFFSFYIAAWGLFCVMALAIVFADRKTLLPGWPNYFRFLTVPWKPGLFLPALLFVTFAGRFYQR